MIGPVQIEMLEGLDILLLKGNRRDVQQVQELIRQIEEYSKTTEPVIVVHQLLHADSMSVATIINQLWLDVFFAPGAVSVTAR